ncbi:TSC22 domain family protein 2-like isoform 1-T1 [Synchiropus picturatus]
MSKVPTKKKSCFQITSVTQAQVAAMGATDDTESLEDPDESQTDDVSAEIFMPRTDFKPISVSFPAEETQPGVGESDAPSHMLQTGQPSIQHPGEFRALGMPGSTQPPGMDSTSGFTLITQPGASQQQASVSVNISPPAAAPPPMVSCTSRFRVIKLDHGARESFRRGRWTCTEFYDKDSDVSLGSRTVESIRQAAGILDPAADRDLLGQMRSSVVAMPSGQGSGSMMDPALAFSRIHSVSGSGTQSAFTIIKPSSATPQPVLQTSSPQVLLSVGPNTVPQPVYVQKSPISAPASQPYPPQHLPPGHHLTSLSPGLMQTQTEYYQQPSSSLQPVMSTGPSTAFTPVSGSAPAPSQGGLLEGSLPIGQSVSMLQQQTGGLGSVGVHIGGSVFQPISGHYAAAGQPQAHGIPTTQNVQNVPVVAASFSGSTIDSTSVPSTSIAAMPNLITHQRKSPGGLDSHAFPPTGFGQVENIVGRRVEGLVNDLQPESMHLATPAVNSLFGIQIPVDIDGERNPSKAFYQAFQSSSRLRDSKAHSDSASGSNVVGLDNKIEKAMDLVKSHLMYAVREEVEVLKEQIKELFEKNSMLERENAVLKSLANSEQLGQLPADSTPPQPGPSQPLHPEAQSPPQSDVCQNHHANDTSA